jgi:hypothetical protein
MFEKIDLWSIRCETGCTCCSYENFSYGFYTDDVKAKEQIDKWSKGIDNPLASQYAKYGRYTLVKHTAEILGDGRMIVDGYLVFKVGFFDQFDY